MLYNFIICEDNKIFKNKYIKIINKIKKDLNISINIYCFDSYCNELENIIYSNLESKIYILDLFLNDKKGNEIAKIVREIDLVSLIIFITSYYKDFSLDITSGEYIYLKFIDKFNDYEKELYYVLNSTIQKLQQLITLKIETKDKIYTIIPKNINYIYTENRKIVFKDIHNNTISISMTLNKIKTLLPDCFLYSKNCCLVNINRVTEIDKVNKIIFFDNFSYTNLVSRLYIKNLINELKKIASLKD